MEAAVLLPVVMAIVALLVQPICLLYTRSVMWEAAGEVVRVAATAKSTEVCRSYALRRLAAVPEAAPFHVGGRADWQVAVSSDGQSVKVTIAGHARPLPLLGNLAGILGERDETGIVLRVGLRERVRPGWLEGSYGSWSGIWG